MHQSVKLTGAIWLIQLVISSPLHALVWPKSSPTGIRIWVSSMRGTRLTNWAIPLLKINEDMQVHGRIDVFCFINMASTLKTSSCVCVFMTLYLCINQYSHFLPIPIKFALDILEPSLQRSQKYFSHYVREAHLSLIIHNLCPLSATSYQYGVVRTLFIVLYIPGSKND